jgi:hypothetical protein
MNDTNDRRRGTRASGARPAWLRAGPRARRPAPLLALAATLLALGAAPAGAFVQPDAPATPASAPEDSGDQLIVKYRGTGAPSSASLARAQATAKAFGVKLAPLRRMSGGEQIYKLDKPLPASTLQHLSQQLLSADTAVEYAEPDLLQHPQQGPGGPM